MTETYYLFLRLWRLILPEMCGRLWGGERAVRISRNNLAHVKKTNRAKHVVDNVLPRFYYVSDFLIGHIGFRCLSGVVPSGPSVWICIQKLNVCLPDPTCFSVPSGSTMVASEPTGMSTVSELRVQLTLIMP